MFSLLLFLAAASAQPAMPAFLVGCWEERRQAGGWTEECWTTPRGGLMIGSGRDGKGDSVGHWEWMRIERAADGSLAFFASPRGAPAVRFAAAASAAGSITFTNAANDYPQRVTYTKTAAGLDAEISLLDGSKATRWSYRPSGAPPKN